MHVLRDEANMIRVEDNGDLRIPKAVLQRLLKASNGGSLQGLKEDQEDFGPGRPVRIGLVTGDTGTEISISRDRRKEVTGCSKPTKST